MDNSPPEHEQDPLREPLRGPGLSASTRALLGIGGALLAVVLGEIAGTKSDVTLELVRLLLAVLV